MGRYLIAGWAGSGKSTIAAALRARGLPSLDSDDVPGLSNWRNRETGEIVSVDYSKPIDIDKLGWMWDNAVFEDLLKQYPTLYFCGNTSYLWHFVDRFDKFFALNISEETQRKRLETRSNSVYGKEPSVLARTLAAQKRFIVEAPQYNAHIINAEQPVDDIVAEIIRLTELQT